jgi:hypothetical protein
MQTMPLRQQLVCSFARCWAGRGKQKRLSRRTDSQCAGAHSIKSASADCQDCKRTHWFLESRNIGR